LSNVINTKLDISIETVKGPELQLTLFNPRDAINTICPKVRFFHSSGIIKGHNKRFINDNSPKTPAHEENLYSTFNYLHRIKNGPSNSLPAV
jgi:hypothetical protein